MIAPTWRWESVKMAADDLSESFEIEKLKGELEQEKQMREMLSQSMTELQLTVGELEKRFDQIDNEGNEWKTRFEMQSEMNHQLEKQNITLETKIDETKNNIENIKQVNKSPRDVSKIDDDHVTLQMVKNLEKQRNDLANQLRDLEWRLDQESKAYHKAHDERKQYQVEIYSAKQAIDKLQQRQRAALATSQRELDTKSKTPRNIPADQRIIDPKKGPINKTAAMKVLPKIDSDNSPPYR
ncbi:unnamed protein product [Owenia fusiformis]|uniref:Uncharacterized protein n=1 Tax=Owenia fusiformis TaxID=6347 RepID=A0A8J1XL23_OWEFU|nr:unnamed protein product [Owenia fusiformis]